MASLSIISQIFFTNTIAVLLSSSAYYLHFLHYFSTPACIVGTYLALLQSIERVFVAFLALLAIFSHVTVIFVAYMHTLLCSRFSIISLPFFCFTCKTVLRSAGITVSLLKYEAMIAMELVFQ